MEAQLSFPELLQSDRKGVKAFIAKRAFTPFLRLCQVNKLLT